jgi:hypothetical protein
VTSDLPGAGKRRGEDHECAARKTKHASDKAKLIPTEILGNPQTGPDVAYKSGTLRTILRPALLRRRAERGFNRGLHIDDRAVEYRRRRHPFVPQHTLRVHGGEVPQHAGLDTAVLRRLRRPCIGRELFRNQVIRIPILLRPPVLDAIQCECRGRRPIGRQNRLPDHEDARRCVRMRAQDRFNCGRPPQARRSRGGKQNDDADAVSCAIEVCAERLDRPDVEVRKRRLPRRCVVGPEGTIPKRRQHDGDKRDPNPFSSVHDHSLWKPIGEQACEDLREQHDEHDDRRRCNQNRHGAA